MGDSREVNPFKPPPDPASLSNRKRRNVKVLEEDEYVENVEKIIERDFFPELDKLKARAAFIDASDRNDTIEMQRLKERFSTGRISRLNTPATFDTPVLKTPEESDKLSDIANTSAEVKADDVKKESLDSFLSKHTSEDNESFNELMEEQQKEFQRTHSWMFKKDEQLSIENKSAQLALPSIEDQFTSPSKRAPESKALDGWTYKNENAVFYPPAGVPMSDIERIEAAKKEKTIHHDNTRFKSNPWKMSDSQRVQLLASKKESELGKVGIDGKDLIDPKATPSVNGYKLLRLDNPTPMIDPSESPFMTWGEVESTPYRLEGADDDVMPINPTQAGAPAFKIQDIPKRDRLAYELAEKNSKFYRDKKNKAIEKARSGMRTPNKGSLTLRVASMSPAAQRLATSKLGIRIGTDKSLKAAYTPSPARSIRSTPTPSSSSRSKRDIISSSIRMGSVTPKIMDPSSLTDDLLKLPSRPSASDFI